MLRTTVIAFGVSASALMVSPAFAQPVPAPAPPPAAPAPAPVMAPGPVAPSGETAYLPPAGPQPAPSAWPMQMRYVEGRPIPPGYHMESRPIKGLVVSGPIIFGVPYIFSASVAASSQFTPDRWLYVPVIGPFADLAARSSKQCTISSFPTSSGTSTTETCIDDSGAKFFLMLDGLMQTAGATMFILGLALPTHLLVRDDAPYTGSTGSHFAWTIGPKAMGKTGYGLGVDGIF